MMTLWMILVALVIAGLFLTVTGMYLIHRTGMDFPVTERLSRKIRSLGVSARQTWAKGLLLVGSLLTRKGMNLLITEGESSPLSSDEDDPFDDFVTRYLEKHG